MNPATSSDVKFGQAVAEIDRMLAQAGIENSPAVATDIMRHLVAEGWRPRARRVDESEGRAPVEVVTKEQAEAYAERIRREMAEKRFRPEPKVESEGA